MCRCHLADLREMVFQCRLANQLNVFNKHGRKFVEPLSSRRKPTLFCVRRQDQPSCDGCGMRARCQLRAWKRSKSLSMRSVGLDFGLWVVWLMILAQDGVWFRSFLIPIQSISKISALSTEHQQTSAVFQ